ncbi:Y-family DNA polymerase [Polycladidibacter stylochi]|uniref:Y-family DNA polymerase n=1 Tax=Polycladidibacter stylochi TaxID=1807766 RepID=UPI00082A7F8C|nr:type VI secretion protein ImpB [Pseudovibrio stylochi]
MRQPTQVEHLYLDFDGFFASVEQQARPNLRGRPVGVVPFAGTDRTCVIACSKEAKARGVKSIMRVNDALKLCPSLVLVPQSPDLYRRAHNALLCEIETVVPIDAIKSIDELACRVALADRTNPEGIAQRIKARIAANVGPHITCSIGFAANRQLAKIAGKLNKPDGVTIWQPSQMPEPLFQVALADIPGIGKRIDQRLARAHIGTTRQLYETSAKQLRAIWGNVTGERLWYALHGYDVASPPSHRGMFGHSRVLPPEARSLEGAREISRLLLIKAARRLRREGFYASGLGLGLSLSQNHWGEAYSLPVVRDDQAFLAALERLWEQARQGVQARAKVFKVSVVLFDLSAAQERQLDMFLDDDRERQNWERLSSLSDDLNMRYGRTLVSMGHWAPPAGGHVGGKISYTRVPDAEDFW